MLPNPPRYVVIDLSAGPCTYGKIETEEGSVNPRTLPRLQNVLFPRPGTGANSAYDVFAGKLAAAIATTIEHVIAPDVRYATLCKRSVLHGCLICSIQMTVILLFLLLMNRMCIYPWKVILSILLNTFHIIYYMEDENEVFYT